MPEHEHLAGIELDVLFRERRGGRVRQGQVHIVPAQKDVLAHRHPRQHQLAGVFAHGNQRQVGRAAAHVAHEHDVADLDLLAPAFPAGIDPGIEGSLRLLEQGKVLQTGRPCRLNGQFPGHRIKRRRHGENDVLLLQPVRGHIPGDDMVPRLAQMPQVVGGGLER